MALTLEDTITLTEIESLNAEVPLDDEQIQWFIKAYEQTESYKGQRIQVMQIDKALSHIGKSEDIQNRDFYKKQFTGQLLSLRIVKPSEEDRQRVAEYEEKQKNAPPGVSYWCPVVGSQRLFLLADSKDPVLYFGIATPIEIDGEGRLSSIPMVKMTYQK